MKPISSQPTVKHDEEELDDFLLDEGAQEDEASYKARPQLSKPGTFLRSLGYLMKALDDGDIDVDPEYQREVVWTADRMTGLVNSLMENFYIPPIILNKKRRPSENGAAPKHTLVCVDGKQRLSSVRAFIKGIIPCHDHRGEKWWFCIARDTPAGRKKKTLSEKVQKEFLAKDFVTFEFADLSQEQEEDLFARVQMGVQLTVAEKMRASTGPWQELARCYVDDFPVIYSLLKDRAHAKDFQMTLSCFSQIIEVQHPTAPNSIPILKTNHSHLPKLLGNKGAVDDGIKSHLASVWNTFQDLVNLDPNTFTNADRRLRGVQTFAPIEMVAVTVLISMYSDSRNNRLLLGDIRALRVALRENFVDLRMNIPLWKFVWDFIHNLEQIRGAVDGTTVDRNVKARPAPAQPPHAAQPSSPLVKRGRPTARTKPPTVLPGSSNANVTKMKTESGAATPADDHRLQKRRRVEPEPEPINTFSRPSLPSPANTIGSSRAIPSPPDTASPDVEFVGATPKSASFTARCQHSATPPAPAQTQPAQTLGTRAPEVQKGRQVQKERRVSEPNNTFPVVALPTAYTSDPQRAPPLTPIEARQNRISELNSYRAPVAPMGQMVSMVPMVPMVPFTSMNRALTAPTATTSMSITPMGLTPSMSPTMPTMSDNHLWSLPTHSMPVPSNTQAVPSPPTRTLRSPITQPPARFFTSGPLRSPSTEPPEIMHSISPAPVATRPTPPQARPTPRPRPKAPARPIPQCDAAIDLTSDDEQDRKALLTRFKATQSVGNPARNSYASSPYGEQGPHNALNHKHSLNSGPQWFRT